MSEMIITPGRVFGELRVQGAKNSVLPIMAASLLVRGEVTLHGCPDLADVDSAIAILRHLGCQVTRDGNTVAIDSRDVIEYEIPDDLMRRMRSSVIFLGAILARCGCANMTHPGGCELGPRPIDMHLDALRRLGVHIEENNGELRCVTGTLIGTDIALRFPSVGATENAMITACAAHGVTHIRNAAREPEIIDLARFLRAIGCHVLGEGTSTLTVEGQHATHSAEHTVIADRIAAGTYLCAAAVTCGVVTLRGVEPAHLSLLCDVLAEAGCDVTADADRITLRADHRLHAVRPVVTNPYPGFPTDLQSPLMAAFTIADGETVFEETIFENRFRHVSELARMGADITVSGSRALVRGVRKLYGSQVQATDLRGGAALIVAALAAEGKTFISNTEHVDRGYENISACFNDLGIELVRHE